MDKVIFPKTKNIQKYDFFDIIKCDIRNYSLLSDYQKSILFQLDGDQFVELILLYNEIMESLLIHLNY
jgi:hypothetical protein